MNWEPVALRAEVDYRIERALGDRTNAEHAREVHHDRQSWWQRVRANHADHHDEGARAA